MGYGSMWWMHPHGKFAGLFDVRPMGSILEMFEKILHLGIVQGFGEQR
jgi:hypothetical protein